LADENEFSEVLERVIRPVSGHAIGLEFELPTDARGISVTAVAHALTTISQCEDMAAGVLDFVGWLARGRPDVGPSPEIFGAFDSWLSTIPDPLRMPVFSGVLHRIRIEEGMRRLDLARGFAPAEYQVEFRFAGSFRINPQLVRVLATGSAVALTCIATTFGAVQVTKIFTASDCRAHYGLLLEHQTDVFVEQAKREGRWTKELEASHESALRAIMVASAGCSETLDHIGLRLEYKPSPQFEVSIGARDRPIYNSP
jgi:hypothetical protein